MSDTDRCPPPDELVQMLLGRLSANHTADLEEHLNCCRRCLVVVEKLEIDSQIVDVLREPPCEPRPVSQPDLESLLSQLEALPRLTHGPESSAGTVTPRDDSPQLAPAEGPGELGRLAHFRVLELLDAGGMGVVYRAEDTRLQRSVALKVLRPRIAGDPDARARFLREARAVASIKHDHVVVVHEVGEAQAVEGETSMPFLAMELLDGVSLQTWMGSNPRPPLAWVVRLGRQIAEALAALHVRGLIHRDVKPANLWLEQVPNAEGSIRDDPSEIGRIKLLDFGLAFTLSDALAEARTLGTPAYMAPEQLRGEPLDGRCDLFGLGCVLYELCTGEHPFPDRRYSAVHVAPFPVNDVNPAVPAELAHLISRLLREDAAARPESPRGVVQELAALEERLSGPAISDTLRHMETAPQRLQPHRPPRRQRWRLLAAGAAALAVVAALVWKAANPQDGRVLGPDWNQ